MIQGYFGGPPDRRRPFLIGRLTILASNVTKDVHFLVDTEADGTLLAPRDAITLGLDLNSFPQALATGVSGRIPTAIAAADLTLDTRTFRITLRILNPQTAHQQDTLPAIPSLLGRDVLQHFAVYIQQSRNLVLLLEPYEADALNLP